MKKEQIVFRDQKQISDALERFESNRPAANALLDELAKIGIADVTIEELSGLLRSKYDSVRFSRTVTGLLIDRQQDELRFGTLEVNREAIERMIVKPDLSGVMAVPAADFHAVTRLAKIANDKVVIDEERKSELINENTATTTDTALLATVRTLLEMVQKLIEAGKINKDGARRYLSQLGVVDSFSAGGELQPNRNLFKN